VDLCGSLFLFFLQHAFHVALIALIDLKKSLPYLNRQACPPFCALSSLNRFPYRRLVFFLPLAAATDKVPWNGRSPFFLIPIISSFVFGRSDLPFVQLVNYFSLLSLWKRLPFLLPYQYFPFITGQVPDGDPTCSVCALSEAFGLLPSIIVPCSPATKRSTEMNWDLSGQVSTTALAALTFFGLFWIVFLYSAQKLYTIARLLKDILAELRVRNALDEKGDFAPFNRGV